MSCFECKNLLAQTIDTPVQSDVSETKYPCTGFVYLAIQNKESIVSKFIQKKKSLYYNTIEKLIKEAGERKKTNQLIDDAGEFINEETVKQDFPLITNQTEYIERAIATDNAMEMFQNELYQILVKIPVMDYLIVNRSNETILFLKIVEDNFLVVDSHQPIHGVVNYFNALRYITRDGQCKGNIQLGYKEDFFCY